MPFRYLLNTTGNKKIKIMIKKEILKYAQRAYHKNLLAAADGNISYRNENGEVLITPSGISKADLTPKEIASVSLDNRILEGKPSSERLMHLAIYNAVPEAKAIFHAHPITAIALSLARPNWRMLPIDALPEVVIATGGVPIAPYARPGTQEMGNVLLPYLPDYRLIILRRHGAECWGESIAEAYAGIERLEQICQIIKITETLGGAVSLPPEEIKELQNLRNQIGPRII